MNVEQRLRQRYSARAIVTEVREYSTVRPGEEASWVINPLHPLPWRPSHSTTPAFPPAKLDVDLRAARHVFVLGLAEIINQ